MISASNCNNRKNHNSIMSYLIKKRKSNNNKVLIDGEPVTLNFVNVKFIKNKYVSISKKDIGQVLSVENNVINLMGDDYHIVSSISVGENGQILLKCHGDSYSDAITGDCTITLGHISFLELHIFFHWKVESFTEKDYFIDDDETETEDEMIEPTADDLECIKEEYMTRLSKEVADMEDDVADKRKLVEAIRQTVDFQKLQNIIEGVEGL